MVSYVSGTSKSDLATYLSYFVIAKFPQEITEVKQKYLTTYVSYRLIANYNSYQDPKAPSNFKNVYFQNKVTARTSLAIQQAINGILSVISFPLRS